jgi:hypothetical protein
MARSKITLDHSGMRELLRSSGVQRVVEQRADAVADAASAAPEVRRNGMTVIRSKASAGRNRARAIVTIAHPGGLAVQAKHGTLSRAVTAAGMTSRKVTRRP